MNDPLVWMSYHLVELGCWAVVIALTVLLLLEADRISLDTRGRKRP